MKKVFIVLVVAFILIQFFQIEKVNPPTNAGMDFLKIKNTPESMAQQIRASCYDCHSNETVYPWYSKVQPFGWFLKDHIDEGRRKLNFSTFATYEPKRQAHKLYEAYEMVDHGEMPLESYVLMHGNAKMDAAKQKEMSQYFKSLEDETRAAYNLPSEGAEKK